MATGDKLVNLDVLKNTVQKEVVDLKSAVANNYDKFIQCVDDTLTKNEKTGTFIEADKCSFISASLSGTGFYGGKNFFLADDYSDTQNGVSLSLVNGVFTFDGTASANTYFVIPLKNSVHTIVSQYNVRTNHISGDYLDKTSGKQIILQLAKTSTSNTSFTGIVYETIATNGYCDMMSTGNAKDQVNGVLIAYCPSGSSMDDLKFTLMITLAPRYSAGDYEYGVQPSEFQNELFAAYDGNCTLQSNASIALTEYTGTNYGALFEKKVATGTNIVSVYNVARRTKAEVALSSGSTVKVIGKNLFCRSTLSAINTAGLKYVQIYLKPNTTYVYWDNYGQWHRSNLYMQIRYGGTTDAGSTVLVQLIDANLGNRNANPIVFKTTSATNYYIRIYQDNIAGILSNASQIQIEEGIEPSGYEPFQITDYSFSSSTGEIVTPDSSRMYIVGGADISTSYYVNAVESADKNGIMPTYWRTYIKQKCSDLKKEVATISGRSLIFQFITDIHMSDNTKNSRFLVDAIRKDAGIDKVIVGGDILNYETEDNAYGVIYDFKNKYVDQNTICIAGNHDRGQYIGNYAYQNILNKHLEPLVNTNQITNPGLTDFFVDNDGQKNRMIFLDTSAWGELLESQYNWLIDALNTTPANYTVIIFTHIVWSIIDNVVNPSKPPSTKFTKLCDEYNLRASGSITLNDDTTTVSYDFTNGHGEVAFVVCGHVHRDFSEIVNNILCIGTTTDCLTGVNTQHDEALVMTRGTTTENAYDVYFVDFVAKTIKTIRIGAGDDRLFSFDRESESYGVITT